MKLFFLFLFLSHFSFSQHSDRFLKLTKNLKHNKITTGKIMHDNKNIQMICNMTTYEFKDESFSCMVGDKKIFYRNGKLKELVKHDDFGNVLSHIFYDLKGRVTKEIIATKIDLISFLEN